MLLQNVKNSVGGAQEDEEEGEIKLYYIITELLLLLLWNNSTNFPKHLHCPLTVDLTKGRKAF